jgi:putative transposase
MTAVCETIGVARSNVAERAAGRSPKRRGRPPLPEGPLLADIKAVIADMPSYGYARVWAVLRRQAIAEDRQPINRKRIYRVMRLHGLLLNRHTGGHEERRHDGKIAVEQSNLRWCSDGFEIACDNAEKVRVAFALDCCDREAVGHVATTEGIKGEDVRDLMVAAVEQRFGQVNRLPALIEWLSDNGSCYTATETRNFAKGIGFLPLTTPVESPQSNGMAEAFVRTFKRDYVAVNPTPDAATVIRALSKWFEHYNDLHPHRALGYRSPREFIASRSTKKGVEPLSGI